MKAFFLVLCLFASLRALAVPSAGFIQQNALTLDGPSISPELMTILKKSRLVAIGEHHGTDLIPPLVGRLVNELSREVPIVLALEIQEANQFGLDEYRMTGDPHVLRLLAHFARDFQDGRSSEAMAQLLSMVRTNPRVRVLAMDPDFDSGSQNRDMKMAQNILRLVMKYPDHHVVVLAGNVHSSTKRGNFFDPNYVPMALHLSELPHSPLKPEDILSVITRYENASFWACSSDSAAECGPMTLPTNTSNYARALPALQSYFLIEPEPTPEGYRATLFLRTVHASPPFRNSQP